MPFSGTTYTNVSGATTASPGQIVQSAVWNNIHTDLATALTQVMSQLVAETTFKNIMAANGSAEIWQRGSGNTSSFTVSASSTQYTADRWYITTGANQQCVVAAVATLTNNSEAACKITRSNGQTGVGVLTFGYPLDTDEIVRMRGNKVTLVGTVKAGANWSPASGTLTISLYVGTGAVAKRGGGFTSETQVLTIATNLTAGGSSVAISGQSSAIVPVTATQAEVQFTWTPSGTAGADDSLTFDDVQLECNLSSQTWTPSQYDRVNYEMQLQLCKRHYQKTFPYATAPAQNAGLAGSLATVSIATQRLSMFWNYAFEMRATAAVTTYNPSGASANWLDNTGTVSIAVNVDTVAAGPKGIFIYSTASGSTSNDLCYIQAQADAGI